MPGAGAAAPGIANLARARKQTEVVDVSKVVTD
jgi:hypothetical protein